MKNKILFAFLVLLLICPAVFSQSLSNFQTIGTVSRDQKALEKQRAIDKQIKAKKKKSQIEENSKEASSVPEEKKVLIKTIVVEGATLLSDEDLKKIISQYEGKELYLSEMQKVTELITDAYRNKGYATSEAHLPAQTIQDNILTIKVIENKQISETQKKAAN